MPPVNWQEEVFGRNAPYQAHNVSVNGGDRNTTFNLSLTANLEDGIQMNLDLTATWLILKLITKYLIGSKLDLQRGILISA